MLLPPAGRSHHGIPSRPVGVFSEARAMGKELTESSIKKIRPSVYLYRAAAAHVRAHAQNITPEFAARSLFGRDIVTDIVTRAATGAATTTGTGWADALAHQVIHDLVAAV